MRFAASAIEADPRSSVCAGARVAGRDDMLSLFKPVRTTEGGHALRLRTLMACTIAVLGLPAGLASAAGDPIMPLSQVQAGMNCTGRTVVQGTTISSFGVHVIDVVADAGGDPRILVSVSGPAVDRTGVAEGFSGSPVYCPDGAGTMRNAGAISEGIGEYGNDVALVTPIEQMLGEPVLPPADAPRLRARATPLLGPLTVGGLSPALLSVLQRAGQRVGRSVLAAPASPFLGYPVQPLLPGASVGVSYSSGAIAMGAVGTVTYTDGPTVYAFGHELDGAGRRSLLLQDAYVYYVVGNPEPLFGTSYKLAALGHTVGTLSSDTPNAVIGTVGAAPRQVPVEVVAHDLDTGQTIDLASQVADETDIGQPLGSSQVGVVAPLEVGQAATQIYDGPPASESGRLCLGIYLRESAQPLSFCNRYVGTSSPGDAGPAPPELAGAAASDVATAFQLINQVAFAKLHVTRVVAQLEAERGLAEATILGHRAPLHVKPGQRVQVHLIVRPYRGASRTVSVPLRIPAGARGRIRAIIRGASNNAPPAGSSSSLLIVLSSALGGGFPGLPPALATSVGALRGQIAGISSYDGLLVRWPGRPPRHLYRDPALLITGRTVVTFQVG
jgi:hypothetical protein